MEENRYKAAIGYILKTSEEDNYLLELINGGYWLSVYCYCDLRDRYNIFLSEYFNLLRNIGLNVDKYHFDKIYYIYSDEESSCKLLDFDTGSDFLTIGLEPNEINEFLKFSNYILFFETKEEAESFLKDHPKYNFQSQATHWEVKEYKPDNNQFYFRLDDYKVRSTNEVVSILLNMDLVYTLDKYRNLFKNKVKY